MNRQRQIIDDEPVEEGLPQYMGTYGDLMSLLMIFFVLLFSFSELDAMKFKKIAGSLSQAFGVQREVPLADIPMGTSVIAQDFSPGVTQPNPIESIKQNTQSQQEQHLLVCEDIKTAESTVLRAQQSRLIDATTALRKALSNEIEKGLLSINTGLDKVTITIQENGIFDSGKAQLHEEILPVLAKIGQTMKQSSGRIVVSGHSDNRPINTPRYPSNWELSSARASVVIRNLLEQGLSMSRLTAEGKADTQPVEPNSTAAGRAQNRRIEIHLFGAEK